MITVTARADPPGWSCDVAVEDARGRSRHVVRVSPQELERYGGGRSVTELVEASFRFLLEREPPGAILASFQLSQIEDYFPEYPERI